MSENPQNSGDSSGGSSSLEIILPLGISFYTFQTIGYTVDVYRNRLKPCEDFMNFSLYVTFFPQLIAGPIEMPTNLIPQFEKKRVFGTEKRSKVMEKENDIENNFNHQDTNLTISISLDDAF